MAVKHIRNRAPFGFNKALITYTQFLVLVLASYLPQKVAEAQPPPSNVSLGVSFIDNGVLLQSENGAFQLEFRQWKLNSSTSQCMAGVRYTHKSPTALIWSAFNIDQPWNLTRCTLELSSDGVFKAILSFTNGYVLIPWQTNTSGIGVKTLSIRNNGNLVLLDLHGSIVWQSFGTFNDLFIIPSGMKFFENNTLYERIEVPEYPDFTIPGRFAMRINSYQRHLMLFTTDNNFVYHTFGPSNASLSTAPLNYIIIDDSINFYDNQSSFLGSIDHNVNGVKIVPKGSSLIGSGTFKYEGHGNFLVSYINLGNTEHVVYYNTSINNICDYPLACGEYGLCDKTAQKCSCPPGFKLQQYGGTNKCTASDSRYNLHPINVAFHSQFVSFPVNLQAQCRDTCSQNKSCNAALFDANTSTCAHFPVMHTIKNAANNSGYQIMFLKIQSRNKSRPIAIIATAAITLVALSLMIFLVARRVLEGQNTSHLEQSTIDEYDILEGLERLPPRFSYKELQIATRNFSTRLGKGGSASVYEGVLDIAGTPTRVAVKKLDAASIGDGQRINQFKAEVATIGIVSHINLVKLKGFCMEAGTRLLVYEFMTRGSLDRWLFETLPAHTSSGPSTMVSDSKTTSISSQTDHGGSSSKQLSEYYINDDHNNLDSYKPHETAVLNWERRCKIALDTARALEYLHHQSADHIVHCDIKPQNILLDENFIAKVADFGIAKQIDTNKESFTMTTLKGTRGYLAPEWILGTSITAKSDVYSYGVVLLELITGNRSIDPEHGHLATWAMRMVLDTITSDSDAFNSVQCEKNSAESLRQKMLDPRFEAGEVDVQSFWIFLNVALACVQIDAAERPSMNSVVQTLENILGVNNHGATPMSIDSFFTSLPSLTQIRREGPILTNLSYLDSSVQSVPLLHQTFASSNADSLITVVEPR